MKYSKNIKFFFRQLSPIIKKEFRQIKRDIRIILILLFFPALMLIMFGYALNFDVKHVSILFCDEDKSQTSREFINRFTTTEYFDLVSVISEREKIDKFIIARDASVAIVIPNKFSKKLSNNEIVHVQVILDGSDGNTAGAIMNYIALICQDYSQNLILNLSRKVGMNVGLSIDFKPSVWFNPELRTAKFLLPGLIAFILLIVCTVSTTLSIVREKENGTMEQLLVSPLQAFYIILGKTIPYVIFSLIAATLILIFGIILFDITIKGNIILLYIHIILFIFGGLGMGIFISTISDSTQVAFQVAALVSLLPTFILSGFVFPIKNMPIALQVISYIVPAKYFIIILRDIILKATDFSAYWEQSVFLFLFAAIMFTLSSIKFSRGRVK
jgi:ABC-2 type transport system permease protein